MSLVVLHAHSGVSFEAARDSWSSLEEFRAWIASSTNIPSPKQILLTGQGKQVRLQSLRSEREIFVYNRDILLSSSSASEILTQSKDEDVDISTPDPPTLDTRTDDIKSLYNITRARHDWAVGIQRLVQDVVGQVQQHDQETNTIQRGTAIAVTNVRQHLISLQHKFEALKDWSQRVIEEQGIILNTWQSTFVELKDISVDETFVSGLEGGQTALERARQNQAESCLSDFVFESQLDEAAEQASKSTRPFQEQIEELGIDHGNTIKESQLVIAAFQHATLQLEVETLDKALNLSEEIDVLSKKLGSDLGRIRDLEAMPRGSSQASKIANFHTNNIVKSIKQVAAETIECLSHSMRRKRSATKISTQSLQQISAIESKVSSLLTKMANFEIDSNIASAFDLLNYTIKLPTAYGLCLVEYVRRWEWQDDYAKAASADRQSMQDAERSERHKWQSSMDGLLRLLESTSPSLEARTAPSQPLANRKTVNRYLLQLKSFEPLKAALKEASEAAATLDAAKTRHPRPRAFKGGSLHEASFDKGIMTPQRHGSSLQTENKKYEEKLRSAESRIRKLEDLLHRQSQAARPPSSGGFTPSATTFERQIASPAPTFTSALSKARDLGSRRSSTSSRRISQTMDSEERSLAQRIVSLEADLIASKSEVKELRKEMTSRTNADEHLKTQAVEAIATKEDLLSNMEAQQHEFDHERRLLEKENQRLNIRIEELEDDYGPALHSEHDNKVHELQDEIERFREQADQIGEARDRDNRLHQEKINNLEEVARNRDFRNAEFESTITDLRDQVSHFLSTQNRHEDEVMGILKRVSPNYQVSKELPVLLDSLREVVTNAMMQRQETDSALKEAQSDVKELQASLASKADRLDLLHTHVETKEEESKALQDESRRLASEVESAKVRAQSLSAEVDQAQAKLKDLEGETRSLKEQLAAERTQHGSLRTRFSSLQGFHGELDDKLTERNDAYAALENEHDISLQNYQHQADRAFEVSKRLQLRTESLRRLLEVIGLVIVRHEDGVVIQKLPKVTMNSITSSDPSASMKRSLSASVPTQAELESQLDVGSLQWIKEADPTLSSEKYSSFQAETDLDMDKFTEAVFKRIKDLEHIARKWQKEAKTYRDRTRRSQAEAHEKVALRSFKEGDLALFLPTRDQATKPWAAFNVGAPHYFLREKEGHRLRERDWLIARIAQVEERVVDLSKSPGKSKPDGAEHIDDNPYKLSDGLRWYMLDAVEEKPGALPSTLSSPAAVAGTGKAKATVSISREDGQAVKYMSIVGAKGKSVSETADRTLARSLDSANRSRRGSAASTSQKRVSALYGSSPIAGIANEGVMGRQASNSSSLRREAQASESAADQKPNDEDVDSHDNRQAANASASPSKPPTNPDVVDGNGSPIKRTTSPDKKKRTGSPEKQGKKWDSLLSLDLNLESAGRK